MVECLTRYRWVAGSSSPEAPRCVLEHDTLSSAQNWFFPDEVGGIMFWRHPCVHPPVCLSTCPSRNIPKYLLVRFDAFSDPLGRFRGWGESKLKLFLNIVMLHIKLKGTTHTAT